MILASAYRRIEDVRIETIIISELKFRNVQRQVLGADFVERANNTALQDPPKALNRIRVNRANNVCWLPCRGLRCVLGSDSEGAL